MTDNLPIMPDDGVPPQSLEERLRDEEPPIVAEDTNPSRTFKRLAAEEPPVVDEDTSPSLVTRRLLSDEWPPRAPAPRQAPPLLAVLLLAGAAVLTMIAALLWLESSDNSTPQADDDQPMQEVSTNPTASATPAASRTPLPTGEPQPAPIENPAVHTTAVAFPTAAADEIASALLTPAPGQPVDAAIARSSEPFTIQSMENRSEVIEYTVQQGDTLESIASKFGLSDSYSLVWSNHSNRYRPLRPGVALNIPPEDGVYYEVTENVTIGSLAETYKVDPYTIIDSEYNELFGAQPQTLLVNGMWVMIPGAEGERINLLPTNPNAGRAGDSGVVSGSYTLWGCTADIGAGSPPYTRPLENYTWMRGFSLGGHEGVDLAANEGTPVFAAGGGTVVYAGWNDTGYGNVVVIAHGAVFSIYGHLDSTAVRCGQSVSAGNVIGQSGNTGRSSGPHLHFELRDANWNAVNPMNYIGF